MLWPMTRRWWCSTIRVRRWNITHLEDMLEPIKGWRARTEATVLITVHILRVARELGDQVAVLGEGKIVAHGAPKDVLEGVLDDQS